MSHIFPETPLKPEDFDWESIRGSYAWVRDLSKCSQDPIHHAEGNVEIHTRMVCEALVNSVEWQGFSEQEKGVTFATALLHDAGKPSTTKEENGRLTSRGHSGAGEKIAREILWHMEVPFELREHVASLIRFHQVPFFLIEREDAQKKAFEISLCCKASLLALQAQADALGRVSEDNQRMLDYVELFREFCKEEMCYDFPRSFASDHSRFLYFRKGERDPVYAAYDDTVCEVTMLSGLPGAGKSTWSSEHAPHLPMVSLDAIRQENKISPADNQSMVVSLAREQAKEYLRKKQDFVWNATSLSRQQRSEQIGLFANYNARVRIVYVEVPPGVLARQNKERAFLEQVPAEVVARLLRRWEVPDLTEAHKVEYYIRDK